MTTIDTMTSDLFSRVRDNIINTIVVAWDGCHKIYMAMDDEQAEWFRDKYPYVVDADCETMLATLARWWEESCGLRFIQAVHTNHDNPNAGYQTMISQFEDEENEDNEEEEV